MKTTKIKIIIACCVLVVAQSLGGAASYGLLGHFIGGTLQSTNEVQEHGAHVFPFFRGAANNSTDSVNDAPATWSRIGRREANESAAVVEHISQSIVDQYARDTDTYRNNCLASTTQLARHRSSLVGQPGLLCDTYPTALEAVSARSMDTCVFGNDPVTFFSVNGCISSLGASSGLLHRLPVLCA